MEREVVEAHPPLRVDLFGILRKRVFGATPVRLPALAWASHQSATADSQWPAASVEKQLSHPQNSALALNAQYRARGFTNQRIEVRPKFSNRSLRLTASQHEE